MIKDDPAFQDNGSLTEDAVPVAQPVPEKKYDEVYPNVSDGVTVGSSDGK